jgi:hypothetical protein
LSLPTSGAANIGGKLAFGQRSSDPEAASKGRLPPLLAAPQTDKDF